MEEVEHCAALTTVEDYGWTTAGEAASGAAVVAGHPDEAGVLKPEEVMWVGLWRLRLAAGTLGRGSLMGVAHWEVAASDPQVEGDVWRVPV